MPLQFDVNVFAAKNRAESFEKLARSFFPARAERMGERAFLAASEADQSAAAMFEFMRFDCAFSFCRAEFHPGDQAAQVFVSFGRSDQQRIAPTNHATDFRADVRANAEFVCGQVELWRAIKAIAIEQRHRGHAKRGAGSCQLLWRRTASEKTKCRAGVQFDVHQSYTPRTNHLSSSPS